MTQRPKSKSVMKSRKIILLIVFILGLLGLWVMASFSAPNACAYASSNLEYIKSKIQTALAAEDLNMSKYHAYKALNGIEKTRGNFLDCGCEDSIVNLENALAHLKTATRAESLQSAKTALEKALANTINGMKALIQYERESSNPYGNDVLVMNTKDFVGDQDWLLPAHEATIKEQVRKSLLEFESSLEKVITDVDCEKAYGFVSNIYEESRSILLNTKLSEYKKQYHQRVKTLSHAALQKIGNCDR